MFIQHNFLRIIRKRTHLTQVDIASLLNISDFANVSRWEKGIKTPNVEILLGYHILFGISVESLFDRQKQELKQILIPRIRERIAYLHTIENGDPKVKGRIAYLVEVLSRLTI
ncbi:MAG: helix-turn-helix transcriptional regulator [Bacteroidetes bacterium]|nr:helix-turn-helix transcriptional regulator [Bacteroidota bacterium]